MRDVILARVGGEVKTTKAKAGNFKHLLRADSRRQSRSHVDPRLDAASTPRSGSSRKFRFVNTHLEAFGDPNDPSAPSRRRSWSRRAARRRASCR